MPKVKFHFMDFEDDLKVLKETLPWVRKNMPDFRKRQKIYFKDLGKKDIINFIKENKDHFIDLRESHYKKVIKEWRKIEKRYFSEIENLTGYKWRFKTFDCYLSSTFFLGGKHLVDKDHLKPHNKIIVCPYTRHVSPTYVIGHELFHAHTQKVISYTNIKLDKNFLKISGPMAEIILKIIFSEIKLKGFNRKVYPQFDKVCKKLKKDWVKDRNFKKLILDTHILLKK